MGEVMGETLYHFTAARLINRIKLQGITLGGVIDLDEKGRIILHRGYIWLTTNPDFYNQEWNSMTTIPYDRAEFRITLSIPPAYQDKVINWLEFCASGGVRPYVAEQLNAFGDPENWRLFKGVIYRKWFTSIDRKPIVAPV
jgi:hypothetical protein